MTMVSRKTLNPEPSNSGMELACFEVVCTGRQSEKVEELQFDSSDKFLQLPGIFSTWVGRLT
jgi:hypothetical protein